MNIEFFIATSVIGTSVDYIFQGQKEAELKSKNKLILTQHSFAYAVLTSTIVSFLVPIHLLIVFLTLFSTHWIIDTRKPVKYIMYRKEIAYEEMDVKYGWLQIELDQILHTLVILMLALVI